MAKILITNNPGVNEIDEAIQLADKACSLTNYQSLEPLTLLISAQARAGNNQEAIRIAKIALSLASSTGQTEIAEALQKSIEFYQMNNNM